jgi:hypothetical protein
MVSFTELIAYIGPRAGGLSLAINAINSRRAYLNSIRPKLNVELILFFIY